MAHLPCSQRAFRVSGSIKKTSYDGTENLSYKDKPVIVYHVKNQPHQSSRAGWSIEFQYEVDPESSIKVSFLNANNGGESRENGRTVRTHYGYWDEINHEDLIILAENGDFTSYSVRLVSADSSDTHPYEAERTETTLFQFFRDYYKALPLSQTEHELDVNAALSVREFQDSYAKGGFTFLDMLFQAVGTGMRLYLLSFEAEIPAGGSSTVDVRFTKPSSFSGNKVSSGAIEQGYDFLRSPKDHFTYESFSVQLDGWEAVDLRRQNFGFDLKEGISETSVNPQKDSYYLQFYYKLRQ